VADGIGSYANGQEASQLAAQTMLETVFPRLISSNNLSDEALTDMIVQGLQQGNQAIYQRNSKGAASMGTTITAALVIDTKAYVVNVGDSRTYHYRPNRGLMQVTRDHSLVAMLVDTHMISPDDIYTHPDRHVIYRGLGEQAQVNVDSFILHLQSGDALLLCSDGLWEMVRNPAIEQIMIDSTLSPAQTSTSLINAALQGGGKDNISVIVVRLTD
jgi:serine/threonine protein phosphatase PrpC